MCPRCSLTACQVFGFQFRGADFHMDIKPGCAFLKNNLDISCLCFRMTASLHAHIAQGVAQNSCLLGILNILVKVQEQYLVLVSRNIPLGH